MHNKLKFEYNKSISIDVAEKLNKKLNVSMKFLTEHFNFYSKRPPISIYTTNFNNIHRLNKSYKPEKRQANNKVNKTYLLYCWVLA